MVPSILVYSHLIFQFHGNWCKYPYWRKQEKLFTISVHLQPKSDSNVIVCGFSCHRLQKKKIKRTLFHGLLSIWQTVQTENEREYGLYNSAKNDTGCKSLELIPPKKNVTFWSKMQIFTLFSYSNCIYISCINWALLSENSNASSGWCDWCYPQTGERV